MTTAASPPGNPKYLWQNRLAEAARPHPRRRLRCARDCRFSSAATCTRSPKVSSSSSGEHDFSANPVVAALDGSARHRHRLAVESARHRGAAAQALTIREEQRCLEENGFSIVDIEPEQVTLRYFRWLPERGEEAIDTLEPFRVSVFPRTGLAELAGAAHMGHARSVASA